MRQFIPVALALLVSFGFAPGDAWAKDSGGDTEQGLSMEESGIDAIDELFAKAKAPIDSITSARTKVDNVAPELNKALGLPADTPFKEGLADLKTKAEGKLEVAVSDKGVPSVTPADGMPDNVKEAVDGLNSGIGEAMAAVASLAEVPAQIQEVIAAAKDFDPTKIKPVTKAPKAAKALTGNLKVLGKAPGEVEALQQAVEAMTKDVLTLKG